MYPFNTIIKFIIYRSICDICYGELDWFFELQEDSKIPKRVDDDSQIVVAVHKFAEMVGENYPSIYSELGEAKWISNKYIRKEYKETCGRISTQLFSALFTKVLFLQFFTIASH